MGLSICDDGYVTLEDLMRKRIIDYCNKTSCLHCPLEGRWNCYTNVTGYELLQNYIKVFGTLDEPEESKTPIADTDINRPSYYNKGGRECIDIMRDLFGDEVVKGFCRCNFFKYRYRAGDKADNDAEKDLKKAEWYEDYLHKMNVAEHDKLIFLEREENGKV